MALDSESFNKDLYDLLKVRGYRPVPLDSKNQRVPASQAADVIEFTFTKDGEDYGKSWVSIDDASNVIVYYDEEQQESPSTTTPGAEYDDSWTGFLKHLKNWAQRRQLSFELSNKDRLGDDMRQRDYYKMKERVSESYHPMGKKASYNDAVPNVKIVLQHNRSLEEGEARFRNVAKIYLENVEGERFLAPTNKPGLARVYARHIAEGGVPNDEKWNHIKSVCEDYAKMAGFVRATRNGQFNESAQELVQEGINHYNSLRETLHKLSTHRGYQNYFESWSPPLMEDELDESINELFVQEMVDPRIESAMPILSRLKKPVAEMAEVDNLAEWADGIINEKLELDEMDKEHGSKRDFDNARVPDKTAKPMSVKQFAKGALKSLKRGMKGWEKGTHDVDSVKAATKSLSPDSKEELLKAKVGKGSPAELQQKLIKREKNKKVDEVLDTTDKALDYVYKSVDSFKVGDDNTKRKRYAGAQKFAKKFKDQQVDEGTDSKLEAFLDQYPEAKDAMYNALRHFEYAYDAMDHVAGHVLHKIPYSEWEKVRQDFIDYFVSKGLKGDVEENFIGMSPQAVAEEQLDELSSDTMQSYRDKAFANRKAEIGKTLDKSNPSSVRDAAMHTQGKRAKGIFRADKKLGKFDDPNWGKGDDNAWIKRDAQSGQIEEDLGPEQKRVGQLGPTEKVKNNNIGKLVGASESKEIDPELARIMEMARFKR